MGEDEPRQLLESLKELKATPPGPLATGASDAEKIAHALHCDAVSHVSNAIDCLKRSIAAR